jgi:hypothetical protein
MLDFYKHKSFIILTIAVSHKDTMTAKFFYFAELKSSPVTNTGLYW